MKLASQIQSSIEILDQILLRHKPLPIAMKDWASNNRYAGVRDRATIINILNAALRQKISSSYVMDSEDSRAIIIGSLIREFQFKISTLSKLFNNEKYAPKSLSENEFELLSSAKNRLSNANIFVKNDVPESTIDEYQRTFGDTLDAQLSFMSGMPDLDIRVNALKSNLDKVELALKKFHPIRTVYSPFGMRVKSGGLEYKFPNLEKTLSYAKGQFEILNEGSQISAILSGAGPGMQVLDYCAGHGGKAAILSMLMKNSGQLYLNDIDQSRLINVPSRMKRLGVKNYQIINYQDSKNKLAQFFDIVFLDAPCSGSGTWRRKPDLKWKFNQEKLDNNLQDQKLILSEAKHAVKIGGKLIYVTCSLFDSENDQQIRNFLQNEKGFRLVNYQKQWPFGIKNMPINAKNKDTETLLLSPMTNNTDGFFVAILERLE